MEEYYNEYRAPTSNHSFIKVIDQAEAILDDELKAISEVDNANHHHRHHNNNNNTSVTDEDIFRDDDDDDLTGELANLESLAALQRELNMSALSFEEFNANHKHGTSKASPFITMSPQDDAVIADVGEIQIGQAIIIEEEEEAAATRPWKHARSLSQDSSIRSEPRTSSLELVRDGQQQMKIQETTTMPRQVVHRVEQPTSTSTTDNELKTNEIAIIPSNDDSEDSSVFQTSSQGSSSGAMHLLSEDRLNIALSPIKFHSEVEEEEQEPKHYAPTCQLRISSQQEPSTNTPAAPQEIFVDTTTKSSSVNIMDVHEHQQHQTEDVTPKIQNTRSASGVFQFAEDDHDGRSADENSSDLLHVPGTPTLKKKDEENEATEPVGEPSPMSLLNTLLSSPEPRFFREKEAPEVEAVATSESSNAGETHSLFSQESASVSSPSSISAASVSSSATATSKSSSQSTDKKKWNPTRLFKQKNASGGESRRKSIFSKPNSKKKKSKYKLRLHSSPPPPVLPTVSEEDAALPAATQTERSPTNITVSPPHDPDEDDIRQTLGMEDSTSSSSNVKRNSLFKDNKERVAVNRMMKMLMGQQQKNKTLQRKESKLLKMLSDARNDRKQLVEDHARELEDLERKMRTCFENNEVLRYENELLLMQTEAWKEISRQSNQTAAMYKYSFDERQQQSRLLYQTPSGETMEEKSQEETADDDNKVQGSWKEEYERKLAQANEEKEELEEKLKQFQKESLLELEDVKYQATWVQRELEQSQSLFEAKLENYMEENLQLKEETATLRMQLGQSHEQVTDARNQVQELQHKLDSNLPKLHSDISNLRIQKLEDQLVRMKDNHQTELSNSSVDMAILQARIENLQTSLGASIAQRHKVQEDLKEVQVQLSRERKSRKTSTRIFLQQNETLAQENRSLQENVKKVEDELDKTRNDQERVEEELVKERQEVRRLEQQAEDEADLIKELQEELESLQAKLDDAAENHNNNKSPPPSLKTVVTSSPQVVEQQSSETQGTLEKEILAAENVALRAAVARLELETKSKPSPTLAQKSAETYTSTYNSPVERRVRGQVLRLRNSLKQKQQDENVAVVAPSPFFSDSSPAMTLTGNKPPNKSQKLPSPKKFVSMLRPKPKTPSMEPRRLDKENNTTTFLSPQRRRGVGRSTRTGLGIR